MKEHATHHEKPHAKVGKALDDRLAHRRGEKLHNRYDILIIGGGIILTAGLLTAGATSDLGKGFLIATIGAVPMLYGAIRKYRLEASNTRAERNKASAELKLR